MLDDEVSSTLNSSATRLVSWAKFSSGNYSTAPSPPYWATCSWLSGVGILGWYSQVSGGANLLGQGLKMEKKITIATIIDMRLRVLSWIYSVAFARCLYLFKFEFIYHFWLWSVCSCWGYRAKKSTCCIAFSANVRPPYNGIWSPHAILAHKG